MITLSLSANGHLQAYCEASGPDDRGYYLDLPEGGDDFKRVLFQALLRRQARFNVANPTEAVDVAEIAKWLEAHPPAPKAVVVGKGPVPKPTATQTDLIRLFGSKGA